MMEYLLYATLFHVPRHELNRVMIELHETLKERGVLFCSNPRGNNQEGLVVTDMAFIIIGKLGKKIVSILDLKR